MATLEHIMVQNFRNIVFADLEFSPGVNCICGNNGQGKTNLLDAVHFLSMTKSALGIPDRYCIRQECRSFALGGVYVLHGHLVALVLVHGGLAYHLVVERVVVIARAGDYVL